MPRSNRSLAEETEAKQDPVADNSAKPGQEDLNTVKEIGGRDGPDPTRYGDWEIAGRCVDF